MTLDFYPSKYYGGDSISYVFSVNNLVSKKTNKTVNGFGYYFKNIVTFGCPKIVHTTFDVYGKFALLDNEDVLNKNIKSKDNLTAAGINFKLALVASKLDPEENEEIDGILNNSTDGKRVKSSFAINMNLCAGQIAQLSVIDGRFVKVMLPFPDGYGPEDKGIEFKAFHYAKQTDGSYKQEEVQCYVTEFGLVVVATSFSPFIVAALESNGTTTNQKVIVTACNHGGTITKTDGNVDPVYVFTSDTITLKITPDSGFVIDTVQINQKQLIPNNGIVEINIQDCQ